MIESSIAKTLFIPLYGRSFVSQKGIILNDKKAEEIWNRENYMIKGQTFSKWLAYEMAMRAKVFDNWVQDKLNENKDAVVLHLGCGLDSRIDRVNAEGHFWFDLDFPSVITVRKKYFTEGKTYKMIDCDITLFDWLYEIPKGKNAIVIMEGFSMYLKESKLIWLFQMLAEQFEKVSLLMDIYTPLAAKLTEWKNPINEVGVTQVYGVDSYEKCECYGFKFIQEHSMTPSHLMSELSKLEQRVFKTVFAGKFSKRLYKLYEYEKI